MSKEIWKDIKGLEGIYQVSSLGRVKAVDRFVEQKHRNGQVMTRLLKGHPMNSFDKGNGYRYISLRVDGKYKNFYVHRLVVEAFIGEIPDGMVVNHLDYNKANNCIDNLEITTQKENVMYSVHLMRKPRKKPMGKLGVRYVCKDGNRYRVIVQQKELKSCETLEEAISVRDVELERLRANGIDI